MLTTTENSELCLHRPLAGLGIAAQLVLLAREALDQPDRAERLVQPLQQLRFQLLDALLAVRERRGVIAKAHEEERDDRQRQQRDGEIQPHEDREHHRQRRDRRRQREDAAHHQVFDRVRVDVDAVDGVGGAGGDVMMQPEPGQVLEQTRAQVVDHALPGVDLHLRAVRRHELVDDLQDHAGDHDRHQQRERVTAGHRRDVRRDPRRKRLVAEHVVDDDCQRPGLQRAEADFRRQQTREQHDPQPVRAQERQRPRQERLLPAGGDDRIRHPPTLRDGATGRCGTRFGAICGMMSGTILSWLESATYSQPARGPEPA